jgi:hypothetical protein
MKAPRKAIETVTSAATDRFHGESVSPFRAATAAAVIGIGTSAMVYKLLRR